MPAYVIAAVLLLLATTAAPACVRVYDEGQMSCGASVVCANLPPETCGTSTCCEVLDTGVVLVVYDSDETLHPSVARYFGAYGKTVHVSRPFLGFGSKWEAVKELLLTGELQTNDVLVVLDGHDVLPNALSRTEFNDRMRALSSAPGLKVVFSGEPSCCVGALGSGATRFFNEDGSRAERASGQAAEAYSANIRPWVARSVARGPANHTFPFLNAGIAVGTAESFLSLVGTMQLHEEEDDQAVLTSLWLHPHGDVRIELDYAGALAMSSNYQSAACPFAMHDGVACHEPGGYCPSFMHFNGNDRACQDQVSAMLRTPDAPPRARRSTGDLDTVQYPQRPECSGGYLDNFETGGVSVLLVNRSVAAATPAACAQKCIFSSNCRGFAHSPGHCAFYASTDTLVAGDTVLYALRAAETPCPPPATWVIAATFEMAGATNASLLVEHVHAALRSGEEHVPRTHVAVVHALARAYQHARSRRDDSVAVIHVHHAESVPALLINMSIDKLRAHNFSVANATLQNVEYTSLQTAVPPKLQNMPPQTYSYTLKDTCCGCMSIVAGMVGLGSAPQPGDTDRVRVYLAQTGHIQKAAITSVALVAAFFNNTSVRAGFAVVAQVLGTTYYGFGPTLMAIIRSNVHDATLTVGGQNVTQDIGTAVRVRACGNETVADDSEGGIVATWPFAVIGAAVVVVVVYAVWLTHSRPALPPSKQTDTDFKL